MSHFFNVFISFSIFVTLFTLFSVFSLLVNVSHPRGRP